MKKTTLKKKLARAKERLREKRRRIAELESAFLRYGRHDADCPKSSDQTADCNCGRSMVAVSTMAVYMHDSIPGDPDIDPETKGATS